jgi:hypothetical protein
MGLLRTAVVDVTSLVATSHALKPDQAKAGEEIQRKLHSRLCRDIKHGTVASIDALGMTRRGLLDDMQFAKCRVAAELQMPHAIAHQGMLGRIMTSEARSLDGMAAARQDLRRLAHLAVNLGANARTALRTKGPKGRLTMNARGAALAEIGPRGATQAERLEDLEAEALVPPPFCGTVTPSSSLTWRWIGRALNPKPAEGSAWHGKCCPS